MLLKCHHIDEQIDDKKLHMMNVMWMAKLNMFFFNMSINTSKGTQTFTGRGLLNVSFRNPASIIQCFFSSITCKCSS